tara:strand:+ start:2889 stop:3350 length:462 start_codon:yes stop_codon:yes gene_type:complete
MSSRIVCNLCSTSFATEKQYKRHLKTKKHINNVEKLDKISQNVDLKNPEDKKDVYVYTTRDFEEATNAYEKVIKELNIELELLKYQLESSKSEKLSINLALKNAEDQLDSNYREINQMNDNLEKHRIDLGDMMDKNIQLEKRIKERFCCFSFI